MEGDLRKVFLNNCRKNKIILDVYLADRHQFCGTIIAFDLTIVILENDDLGQFLLPINAITAIVPCDVRVDYIFKDSKNDGM